MGGMLMFSSTGTFEENYWIVYNLLEKEDIQQYNKQVWL